MLDAQGFFFLSDLSGSVRFDDKATTPASPFVQGDWFQVAKTGRFFSPVYGQVDISPDMLATMYRNFKTKTPRPPTQLPIDYDHLSDDPKQPEDGMIGLAWPILGNYRFNYPNYPSSLSSAENQVTPPLFNLMKQGKLDQVSKIDFFMRRVKF